MGGSIAQSPSCIRYKNEAHVSWRVAIMEDFPGSRQERFTGDETEVLIRAVKERVFTLYGDERNPPRIAHVRQAWEEISRVVSLVGNVRTPQQCRKRYNDVRRRGKAKLAMNKRMRESTQALTAAEDIAASTTLSAESVEGFGGSEVDASAAQFQAWQEELSLGSSGTAHGPAKEEAAQPTEGGASRPARHARRIRPEHRPFPQLQQTGFHTLERELSSLRRSTNARLDRLARHLRPLGRIAASLERIAAALERHPGGDAPERPPAVVLLPVVSVPPAVAVAPPPPPTLPPPLPARSPRSTLRPSPAPARRGRSVARGRAKR